MKAGADALLAWKAALVALGKLDGRIDALVAAAEAGRIDEVRALIREGADVDARGDVPGMFGATPLYAASVAGHADVVRALIEANARLEELTEFHPALQLSRGTALGGAAQQGQTEIVRILLAAGVDPNRRLDPGCNTPLMRAARAGKAETVRVLLEAGADPNLELVSDLPMTNGKTAHTYAKEAGYQEVVEILERAGAVEVDLRSKWPAPRPGSDNPFIR